MPMPDTILLTQGLGSISAGQMLVTPTGGSQGLLEDLLTTATGGAVSATTLTASGDVTLSPTGTVVVDPSVAGSLDNVTLGVSTPLAVHATTLGATGAVTLTNAVLSLTAIPTADPHVVGHVWANSGVLTISAG